MNRRRFMTGLAGLPPFALALAACTSGPAGAQTNNSADLARTARPIWDAWKSGFLEENGRVIDALQQQASHSEGQGYGMLLATEFADRDAFERMYAWTEANLAIRDDQLLAWRWLPEELNRVPDRNNASDGDLFYAWALQRAASRFGQPEYLVRARAIVEDLVRLCIMVSPEDGVGSLFLPAAHGFVHDETITLNPSYYMPRAMRELAAATGEFALSNCARDGELLMARIASQGLVPDWIEIGEGGWEPSERMSSNAGYEAIRVPLFLIWSGQAGHPAVDRVAQVFTENMRPGQPVPVVIERMTGAPLETSPDAGYGAVAALTGCAREGQNGAALPPFTASQPYYPATLQLFAMIAVNETFPQCVPL